MTCKLFHYLIVICVAHLVNIGDFISLFKYAVRGLMAVWYILVTLMAV